MDTKLDRYESKMESKMRDDDSVLQYRSISKAAVAGMIFAVLSVAFLIASILIILPVIALGLSLIGISNLRRYPEELIGKPMARFGLTLSLITLFGGIAWHTYVYMTEVPDGYQRISFRMLKDDKSTEDVAYSEKAIELDQTKVFLKGYVRPGTHKKNLKDFILVGDFGACCFGGSPEITDVVAISIQGEQRVNYGLGLRKIAGTFRLNKRAASTAEKEVPRVFYQIDADKVK